ncbi:MAG: carbon-nitrogen hydrolase family protein [Acidobacteria bacterium]|nr:carbon-nitrogen hydrolase family protein [Acidobacteriota bacterium]
MLALTLLLLGPVLNPALPSGNLVTDSCWESFAPRAANAPEASRTTEGGDAVLSLASGGKRFVYGGWRCRVEGIEGGGHYRLHAQALPAGIGSARESLTVLLRWKGDFGAEVAPAYVWETRQAPSAQGALLFDRVVQAPPRTKAVDVELVLQWSAAGRVSWRQVSLTAAPPPSPRKARVAAVWFRPRGAKSGAEAMAQVAAFADAIAAQHRPDVVLLGEAINHAGAPGSLDDHAEPIPGPTIERFAELARRHSTYVAFSLLERSGPDIFNTGVLIDRRGRVAGTYRKVQLPQEEVAAGEAPGYAFPVFQADFGRVGLMICHDTSFPEPAVELSRAGAELILVPIWGGRTPLVRARAIENGVWLATAGYDYDSEIVDPQGNVLATVPHDTAAGAAVAEIDFNRTFPEPWIGNWRDTVSKQRR